MLVALAAGFAPCKSVVLDKVYFIIESCELCTSAASECALVTGQHRLSSCRDSLRALLTGRCENSVRLAARCLCD